MHPVNLIPPEERRGDHAQLRTGALPYAIVGILAVALVAVTALVLTGNQISEREAQVASLEAREIQAAAQAEALLPYAEFASLSESRSSTVASLAQSRFDWERVLRELALIIPEDVSLTQLSASSATGSSSSATSGGTLDQGASGPSMSMTGCANGHNGVAAFLQALKDIDGVTRVGITKSELPADTAAIGGPTSDGPAPAGSDQGCQTRSFISQFEIVVTFDAASMVAAVEEGVSPPESVPPPAEPVDGASTQQPTAAESVEEQTGEARRATNLIPGVAR